MNDIDDRRHMADLLLLQACAPDPFYAPLLTALADDVAAGGDTWRPLAPLAGIAVGESVGLRLMAAAHRLALRGEAPDYAAHLLTCGGDGDPEGAWPALRDLCVSGALDDEVHQPVQTNEVSRTAALLPGFSAVAGATGLPLRLLEIGASAGLLLRFDRYGYTIGTQAWGDRSSPVQISAEGEAPLGSVEVVDRRGCDIRPLDPVRDRTLLLSFIWPSQLGRFRTAEAALTAAADHPVAIDEASASRWLGDQLGDPRPGQATVIYHSIVWQYLPPEEQEAVAAAIDDAGSRATTEAPVAWLRLEPHATRPDSGAQLRLTLWPGGEDRALALCGYHGGPIRWGEEVP